VVVGGTWAAGANVLHSSYRDGGTPDAASWADGFRVARNP
jgi:formylglycine-generating enzyme required for sulfatase activity